MTERYGDVEPIPFGTELHRLLALICLKRSAFGERGYPYYLHKQICRGERAPSARALAAARRDPAKLEHLERHLAARRGCPS